MMSFRKVVNLDLDDETEKFLMEEFYYLLQISGVFLYMRGKWFYFSIFHYLVFQFALISSFLQFLYTTYLIKEEMSVAALSFHIAGGLGVCITIMFILAAYRNQFIEISKLVCKNFYDYGQNYDSTETKIWLTEMRKFKKVVLIGLVAILSATALQALILGPIQDEFQGYTTNETFINDVYMLIPVPLWFPFSPNFYVAIVYEIFCAFTLITVLIAGIIMILYYTQAINVQLRILIHSIENIEKRALFLCHQSPDFPKFTKREELYKNSRFVKHYLYCMSQNIEHHNIILRSQTVVYYIQKWPMFNVVFFMSLVMACTFFVVLKGENRIAPLLLSLLLFIMETVALIFICMRGQELIDESDRLFSTFYRTKWFLCPEEVKKAMIIIQEKCKQPMSYKAGGFTEINWELFGSIVLENGIEAMMSKKGRDGEFPYAIGITGGEGRCSGALIKPSKFLSAAHCFRRRDGSIMNKNAQVVAGVIYLRDSKNALYQSRKIAEVKLHPDLRNDDTIGGQHDIALGIVEKPFELSKTVKTATFVSSHPEKIKEIWYRFIQTKATCFFVGFGVHTEGGKKIMDDYVRVSKAFIWPDEKCDNLPQMIRATPAGREGKACIHPLEGTMDFTNSGDSGGPVMCGGHLYALVTGVNFSPDAPEIYNASIVTTIWPYINFFGIQDAGPVQDHLFSFTPQLLANHLLVPTAIIIRLTL